MNTPELTFEQAARLSRWLSGDREGINHSIQYRRNPFAEPGRWIWIHGHRRTLEVWIPASFENEHTQTRANL